MMDKKFDWLKTAEKGAVYYKNFLRSVSDIGELLARIAPNRETEINTAITKLLKSTESLIGLHALMKKIVVGDLNVALKNRGFTEIECKVILARYDDGWTIATMSKIFNLSRDEVKKILDAAEKKLTA